MGERLVIGTAPRKRLPVKPVALILGLGLVAALALTRLVFFELVQVRGDTMAPNAMEGDILLISSLATPSLGSVVLVEQGEREVLRRVVALAGDHVATVDGVIERNGHPLRTERIGVFGWLRASAEADARPHRQVLLDERFADGRRHRILGDHDGAARPWRLDMPELEVPPGHVFVLCDNRRICPLDDQAGPVALHRITGVARSVLWLGDAREVPPAEGGFEGLGSRVSGEQGDPARDGADQSAPAAASDGGSTDGAATAASDAGMGGAAGADSTVDSPRK